MRRRNPQHRGAWVPGGTQPVRRLGEDAAPPAPAWEELGAVEEAEFEEVPGSLPVLASEFEAPDLLTVARKRDSKQETAAATEAASADAGAPYVAAYSVVPVADGEGAPERRDDTLGRLAGESDEEPEFLPPVLQAGPSASVVVRDDEDGDGAREEGLYAAAMEASLEAPATRSVVNHKNADTSGELSGLFEVFRALEPGERARVQVVARVEPHWGRLRRAELDAQDLGVQKVSSFSKLWWLGQAAYAKLITDAPVPERPGQVGKTSRKSREEKAYFDEADAKLQSNVHYAADLRVAVFGRPAERERLDALLTDAAEHGFDAFRTTYQSFAWEPCDPMRVTAGLLSHARGTGHHNAGVFSPREMAAFARLADGAVLPAGVQVRRSSLLPLLPGRYDPVPEPLAPPRGLVPYAALFKGSDDETAAGLQVDRLDSHMFIQGRAGTGKTELLKWLALGIVRNGEPLVVIDPHGEFAGELVGALCVYARDRLDDLVYVDLADKATAPAINPLDVRSEEQVGGAVRDVLGQLDAHLGINAGSMPRAIRYIELALTAMAEANFHIADANAKLTLINLADFFRDPELREAVVRLSTDMDVLATFAPGHGDWDKLSEKDQQERATPIVTKLASLSKGIFGSIFSSSEDRLDWAGLVAQNKVVIVNLARMDGAQAHLGEFVGGFILPALWAGQHRFRRVKHKVTGENIGGQGVFVIVDEAPAIMKDAVMLPTITAEARKSRMALITACQYPRQFNPAVLSGLMANTATKVSLALGAKEAAPFAEEVSTDTVRITPTNIASLENFQGYCQVKEAYTDEAGETKMRTTNPFAIHTLPPVERYDRTWREATDEQKQQRVDWTERQVELVRARSRELVGNPVELMRKRLALLPGSVEAGVPRRAMTERSLKALHEVAAGLASPDQQAAQQLIREHEEMLRGGGYDEPDGSTPVNWDAYSFEED